MDKVKKLHFLMVYPLHTAPSQRFRFEQFFPYLDKAGFDCSADCFYDEKTFSLLYAKGSKMGLAVRMFVCFLRRCGHMFTLAKYDYILIQRGAAPFGPPFFEWVIRYVYHKPIIYDFDDAIWLQPEKKPSRIYQWIKSYSKVGKICRWAHVVVTGNQYLAAYARKFAKRVEVIPTVVNTEKTFTPGMPPQNEKTIIGWTGSHSTLPYLQNLEALLTRLQNKYDFELMVMANKPPQLQQLHFYFVPWSEEAEVKELNKIDIGIMPLPDNEWAKGKCGFKAIQYMALQKPAVASAVGVNTEIIDPGVNGFLCSTESDWEKALECLLKDEKLRQKMGKAGRRKIVDLYSVRSKAGAFIGLFS
jgi:glycosyltransferase involved in cell wall biosynthesis